MRFYDIIEKKKRGEKLTYGEIMYCVNQYTAGDIPDYQMSAFLMAVYFRGMAECEVIAFTEAIERSGEVLDLSAFGDKTVDKHSTGGVGDKTTLIVAPIAAAMGATVAKMSGRGLGHTGGTVDKLEAIKGYRTSLTPEEFERQVKEIGISVISQSGNLAPADKKIYSLRDVTATVDCIPLIASSIMGKKLATSTRSLVLDVKCGDGAFMKTPEEAENLAEIMVKIGESRGRKTAAVITDMSEPLGRAVGNAIEVREALDVLGGEGPSDLKEISLELAAIMCSLALGLNIDEARDRAKKTLENGNALRKFNEWIRAQGGNTELLMKDNFGFGAKYKTEIYANKSGFISECFAEKIGLSAMAAGAGRAKKDDGIDADAGIYLYKKRGDAVTEGEALASIFSSDEKKLQEGKKILESAYKIGETQPSPRPLIIKTLI